MRHKNLIFFISLFFYSNAQEDLSYQSPPENILELIDVALPPRVLIDEKKEYMVYLYRDNYKTIEQLSEKELRLAGLRINPKKNIGSRISYYNNLKISLISDEDSNIINVKGLPKNPQISNIKWSPDQNMIAMTNTTKEGVELWVLDVKKAKIKKIVGPRLNANLGLSLIHI